MFVFPAPLTRCSIRGRRSKAAMHLSRTRQTRSGSPLAPLPNGERTPCGLRPCTRRSGEGRSLPHAGSALYARCLLPPVSGPRACLRAPGSSGRPGCRGGRGVPARHLSPGVVLAHLIDAQHQSDTPAVLAGEFGEQERVWWSRRRAPPLGPVASWSRSVFLP